jgi:hypothetical protein
VLQIAHKWRDEKTVELRLRILKGFHINAHETPQELIPTELHGAERVEYPPGEPQRTQFADDAILVYRDEVTLVAHLASVTGPVLLTLRFQPCNETSCLSPTTIEFEIPAPGA